MSSKLLLLTVDQAAEALNCGRAHIYNLAKRGEVPVVKLGRAIRVPRAWIEEKVAQATRDWETQRTDGHGHAAAVDSDG
jgi:excisionase family DNA binding protein